MVHMTVAEKRDPRKVINSYLMAYRATPHKTTGLSPYEMKFGRKIKTKLPQNLKKKKGSDREEEARARHDLKKSQQKEAFDRRQKAKEKKLNKGDEVLIQQKKSSVKSPWDPEGFKVKEVKGSKVILQRGEETKIRAKNNVKVVKKRPKELEMVLEDVKPKRKRSPEPDLEVSWETIQAMGDQPEAPGPPAEEEEEGQEEGAGRREEGPPEEEEEDRPELQELPESEEEEEEEEAKQEEEEEVQGGGRGHIAELEGIRLMDTLHLGGYWPVQEGAERRRRPPPKLGVEQERGFWEERLPRELSMGDPGSRQLTPQPSPPALQLDRRHGLRVPAAARDSHEINALQLDMTKPPRCNLICFHHFCPDWAGEEEPDQMEEIRLPRPGTK